MFNSTQFGGDGKLYGDKYLDRMTRKVYSPTSSSLSAVVSLCIYGLCLWIEASNLG
jgi:hypothetical protein